MPSTMCIVWKVSEWCNLGSEWLFLDSVFISQDFPLNKAEIEKTMNHLSWVPIKPVLGGVGSIAYLITGHEHTQ